MYIERDLEKEILRYLESKEIIAVVGARQCGKTTLVNHILDGLNKKKKINRISFDNVNDLQLFENDIYSFINENVKGFDILFIDEVHYAKESGKKLKYIYDTFDIKIFISGSSAPEISIQSMKFLVGRIFTFFLYPFSFKEFLRFKDDRMLTSYESGKYKEAITSRFNRYLYEFILFGGYPRVVLSKSSEDKKKILENLFSTYLLREIKEILDLSDDSRLINLLKALSLQTGNIINYNELSNTTGFSFYELKKYLNILEKTYISALVRPFFQNKRTELVKNPKVYFVDTGFRNIAIDNFSKERSDKGSLYENFIFSELMKNDIYPRFWNTKSKAEVDFIVEKNGKIIPIEVKSLLKETNVTNSFKSFISKYGPKKAFYLSSDLEGKKRINGCVVNFLPYVKFTGKIKNI